MNITLPLPPGINRTYGINRDAEFPLYKRKKAKDWEEEAGWSIKEQFPGFDTITGPVKMGITWYYEFDRDIDAGQKLLFDLLETQRIYANDRQIREIMYIKIFKDKKNPRVEVELYEMVQNI